MQINITGNHTEITPALRTRVEKSIQQLVQHTDLVVQSAHVVLGISKNNHHCDIQLKTNRGQYVAKDDTSDMYTAIDRASQKVRRQIEDDKGKDISRRNQPQPEQQ